MFLTQTNWGGGASTTLFAIHPTNLTNWTNFYSTSTPLVNTSVAGQVSLTLNEGTATQTSDADFNTWSKPSNVYIPTGGNKITLLKPNGASCTTGTQCLGGGCNGSNVCYTPPCAGLTSVSYSGQTYNLVNIGNQCWFSQNLNVGTKLASAGTMPSNNSLIEKWCYSNSDANCTTYGGLYTWAEANQLAASCSTSLCTPSSPSQGICPSGWHIPTDAEVKTLEMYLGMTQAQADLNSSWRGTDQGTQLKTGGSSGFNLPGGSGYQVNGGFYYLNNSGSFQTATEYNATYSYRRYVYLGSNYTQVYRTISDGKSAGYSVRCLKN